MSAVLYTAEDDSQKNMHYDFEKNKTYCALDSINGIKFTPREIDIIACILGGRGRKTSGSLLSIAEKTVESHIRNILHKLGCHSQEGIRDRLEKSDKFVIIKQHYQNLLTKMAFEQALQQIALLIKKSDAVCLFVIWQKETPNSFVSFFEENIRKLNMKFLSVEREKYKSIPTLVQYIEEIHASYVIHTVCQTSMPPSENKITKEFLEITKKTTCPSVFLLESKENFFDGDQTLDNVSHILINDDNNYFLTFFNSFKELTQNLEVNDIISSFERQYKTVNGTERKFFSQESESNDLAAIKSLPPNSGFGFLKNRKKLMVTGGIASLIIINFILLFCFLSNKNYFNKSNNLQTSTLRSDFITPPEAVFLHRSELISQIANKFKGQSGIHTVALVGVGGSGKTTLSREYAHKEMASIVWELNAETYESLKRSFENLAQALSKTEEDTIVLRRILEAKNSSEKENSIIHFVKERLKSHPDWFLIYDNVEKLSDLQKYFPQDPSTWGNGKIILTTRDSTIQNTRFINDIVHIGELNADQKLNLFTKIMNQGNQRPFIPLKIKETKIFLEKIPPFPLDISVAAYYLNATHVSYDVYINNINTHDQDFINTQENLLKGAGDYTKSRYVILTLSLQRLIDTHKDFKDLLLFISLLNSQNIPIDMLKQYKGNTLIDNFIYNLKKYSFITNEQPLPSLGTAFSIHHSTQTVGLAYLTKELDLKKKNQTLQEISECLENYIDDAIDKENLSKLKILADHSEMFLSHNKLLSDETRASLEGVLGCVYFYLCNYTEAKQLLEKNLIYLNQHPSKNHTRITRTLTHLGNVYRELGYYDKAKDCLEQAVGLHQKFPSENHIKMAQSLAYLGNVHRNLGDYKRAQNLLESSLLIYKKHFPENNAGIARLLSHLGHVYKEQGEYKKAKDFLEKSLVIYKEHFPDDHLGVIRSLMYLANLHKSLGNYEKAKTLLEQSLSLYKKYFPEDHRDFAWAYVYLGNVNMDLGNYEKAKNLLEEGFVIHKKYFPHDHMDAGWILTHLGNAYKKLGNYEKAKIFLEQSIGIYKKYLSENHIDIAWASVHLAGIYSSLGDFEKARNLLAHSLIVYKNNFPENHTDIAWIKSYLGESYYNLKNYTKAKAILEESISTYKTLFKDENVKISSVYVPLANVYKALGDSKKAKYALEKSLVNYEKHYGKDHIKAARALRSLAQIYLSEGNIETAETLMNKTLNIFQQNKHSDVYIALEDLADLNLKKRIFVKNKENRTPSQNTRTQAISYLEQALEVIKAHFPENSPHAMRIHSKLKSLK